MDSTGVVVPLSTTEEQAEGMALVGVADQLYAMAEGLMSLADHEFEEVADESEVNLASDKWKAATSVIAGKVVDAIKNK